MQRQRNDKFIKANDASKQRCVSAERLEIDWEGRRLLVSGSPADLQGRDTAGGSCLPPFTDLKI